MKAIFIRASVVSALALGLPALAHAQPGGVQVGTLSCHQHSGWGFFIGSSRRVSCVLHAAWGSSFYTGRMSDAGIDVGYHGPSEMVWAVFAPTNRIGPGALSGQYGGATAGGAVGVGVSANGLVGGSDRTIQLQPFSVSGNTGLSATAGIAGMSLLYQPPRRAMAVYRRTYERAGAVAPSEPPPPEQAPPPARIPRG